MNTPATMQKILQSETTIRFMDCDPYGHLNNSRYIDYFLNAREDQVLEAYDLNIYARAKNEGLAWVVAQHQIAYLQPVGMTEPIIITSKIISLEADAMTVEFQMVSREKERVKAIMWSRFVHFNLKTQRRAPHDTALMERFSEVAVEINESTFDARLKALRNGKRD